MLLNNNGSIAGNITSNLFLALLVDEASKAAYIDIMPARHGILYNRKKGFNGGSNICLVNACLLGNLVDNVCFRHGDGVLVTFLIRDGKINLLGQN